MKTLVSIGRLIITYLALRRDATSRMSGQLAISSAPSASKPQPPTYVAARCSAIGPLKPTGKCSQRSGIGGLGALSSC
jgi:hypothetical protein